jgi:hypothetical protein
MTELEMYEKSFERPRNFLNLSPEEQWRIDKELGILDWMGINLTESQIKRLDDYYDKRRKV